jgi:hypothetical protein
LFLNKFATLIQHLYQSSGLLLLLIPIITMRLFAEERKTGTLELLLTAPVRESQVVLAKYLCQHGGGARDDRAHRRLWHRAWNVGSPIGARSTADTSVSVLLAEHLVALGLTVSALTSNQVASRHRHHRDFVSDVDDRHAGNDDARGTRARSDQLFVAFAHFTPFAAGAMYTSDLGFFVSTALLALFLAMRAGEKVAMGEGQTELGTIGWFLGWAVAIAVLFFAGLRLPLQKRFTRGKSLLYTAGVIAAAFALSVLANIALLLHDAHIDLTREKLFTPSRQAMAVVDELQRPVRLTYFYSGQDPEGRRIKDVLEVMGRRNSLLQVRTVDPDREPSLAQSYGMRVSNAGILEAEGRKLLIQTTDESDMAIGIQRILRENSVTACFLEGHSEFPMDNFEFHTR